MGTYFNDHSTIWQDGRRRAAGAALARSSRRGLAVPEHDASECAESTGLGDGECYFVDSTRSNSWRQLRINNASMNRNYLEYDPEWKFRVTDASGAGLQHYELYDISADPYQMNNLYGKASVEVRAALHAQLAAYYNCRGASCP